MKVLWVRVGNLLRRLRILARLEMGVGGMRGGRFGLLAGCQLLLICSCKIAMRGGTMRGGAVCGLKIRHESRKKDIPEKRGWRPYMLLVRNP